MGSPTLSKCLPIQASKVIEKSRCTKCSKTFGHDSIAAIGIRKSDNIHVLYVEHECPQCHNVSTTTFPSYAAQNMRTLCRLLLEEMSKREVMINSLPNRKNDGNAISVEELEKMKEYMANNDDYTKFMNEVGADRYLRPAEEEDAD